MEPAGGGTQSPRVTLAFLVKTKKAASLRGAAFFAATE